MNTHDAHCTHKLTRTSTTHTSSTHTHTQVSEKEKSDLERLLFDLGHEARIALPKTTVVTAPRGASFSSPSGGNGGDSGLDSLSPDHFQVRQRERRETMGWGWGELRTGGLF